MKTKILEIEGIGSSFYTRLEKAGIKTVEDLLEKGATKSGRKAISSESGLDEGKILDFVNMADLFRIKGIGSEFSELLKASGVDTVKELRNRNAANLHTKLMEVNAQKKLTRNVPSEKQLEGFIIQAKKLAPMVTY